MQLMGGASGNLISANRIGAKLSPPKQKPLASSQFRSPRIAPASP
jgi:hypothetical protein